jgi:parallel beta-helix repeat protein
MFVNRRILTVAAALALLAGCNPAAPTDKTAKGKPAKGNIVHIKPGKNVQEEAQTALIKAKPGTVIEFAEGTYHFTGELSLKVKDVTIRGQGMDKTILSFKGQDTGKQGLSVTADQFVLESMNIQDTKGDAVKVTGADGVTFRKVKAEWTGEPKETNGAYGLYPVECKNVLVEECVAIGASDAGIYVGQSQNVVVRKCKAERNVAGIEIENCTDAEVHDCEATDNSGGLLVFDLPGLKAHNGQRVRVHDNRVYGNNHKNFAAKGTMVADVAPGTGMMVLATDQVEMFKNTVKDNQTYGLIIVSFLVTGRKLDDKNYDPYPEAVYVHNNSFTGNGTKPSGERGTMLAALLGTPMPDIIYDGLLNPKKVVKGKLPKDQGIYVKDNGKATWVNLHWDKLNPKDPQGSAARIERNPKDMVGELPPLPKIELLAEK